MYFVINSDVHNRSGSRASYATGAVATNLTVPTANKALSLVATFASAMVNHANALPRRMVAKIREDFPQYHVFIEDRAVKVYPELGEVVYRKMSMKDDWLEGTDAEVVTHKWFRVQSGPHYSSAGVLRTMWDRIGHSQR